MRSGIDRYAVCNYFINALVGERQSCIKSQGEIRFLLAAIVLKLPVAISGKL